jgi:hypothetical protein
VRPHAGGATTLIVEPLDFLRRLAGPVSVPHSHQVRYYGVFANRSKGNALLPPPSPSFRHFSYLGGLQVIAYWSPGMGNSMLNKT